MIEKLKDIPEGWLNFFIKVILVAIVAMSIKIAIIMRKEKITVLNIFLSFVIGIGFAALTGTFILEKCHPSLAPIFIGIATLLGEKIGIWIMYKFNIDALLQDIASYLTKKLKK